MTPEEIRKWLEENYSPGWRVRALLKHPAHLEAVKKLYSDTEDDGEVAYLFVNGISRRPVCDHCGGRVNWFGNRFAKTCSVACANHASGRLEKARKTMQARYGVTSAAKIPESQDKRRKTMQDRYGAMTTPATRAAASARASELQSKGRRTIRERYGVENSSQLPGHSEKVKKTLVQKHGVAHPSQIAKNLAISQEERIRKVEAKLPEGVSLKHIHDPGDGEANFRYELQCSCGITETIASETFKFRLRKGNHVCSNCLGLSTARSMKERAVVDYIKSVYQGQVIENDRSILKPYELDVVLPDLKLAIEFCGLFWHSDEVLDDPHYHADKLSLCQAKGFRLITIFEDEWEFKTEIVKKRLAYMVGAAAERHYARQCTIRSITVAQARAFCEEHHIQGYAISTHKFGLFSGDDLVAVMTFAKPGRGKGHRKVEDNVWELSRFCAKGSVIGGANKLFQHFVSTVKPVKVITYSDRRWNTGSVYETMGFEHSHTSRPNYWYFKGVERVYRYALRKQRGEVLPEKQMRRLQGWRIIYDCGNECYVWRPSLDAAP